MRRNILLTVSIGDEPVARKTIPRMRRYAQAHDADIVIMRESRMFQRPTFAYWEGLLSLTTSHYDSILKLDSDILIRNDAPNIFTLPFSSVAMKPSGYIHPHHHRRIRDQIAKDFLVNHMFNAGVILMSRDYLAQIAPQLRELSRRVEVMDFADQVFFCLIAKRLGVTPTKLSWRWNQHDQVPDFRARLAHFLHFRGPDKVRRVNDFLSRNPGPYWSE